MDESGVRLFLVSPKLFEEKGYKITRGGESTKVFLREREGYYKRLSKTWNLKA